MSPEPLVPPRPDALDPWPPPPDLSGPRAGERPPATWSWVEGVGVYVVAVLLAGMAALPVMGLIEDDVALRNIVGSALAASVIVGVLVGWLRLSHRGWLRMMGLPASGRWGNEMGAGVAFGLGLYPVMVLVVGGILLVLLEAISGEPVRVPEQVGDGLSTVGIAVTAGYAIVIAPIGEELFFRGVLFRALRDRHGFRVGAIGSGLGFGLIHFIPGPAVDALLLMIVMVFTGIGLAYLYERRDTIVAPIAAHVTFNGIGLVLILGLR